MKTDQDKTSHLLADAVWEMDQVLGEWRLPLELDAPTVMQLVAALQLALRHPRFKTRPSGKAMRRLVDQLVAAIPESAPATKLVAELGNDPHFDFLAS